MTRRYRGLIRAHLPSALICFALLTGGCGGSVESDSASRGPIARADLSAVFNAARCNGLAPCCASVGFRYDASACQQRSGYIERLLEFVDDGYETYDPVAARRCVDAWVAAEQSCSPKAFDVANPLAVCEQIIQGTEPPGAPCNTVLDCAAPVTNCALAGPGGEGHCQTAFVDLKHGRAGEACTQSCPGKCSYAASAADVGARVACYEEDGLACGPSHLCEPPAEVGQGCDIAQCVSGALCASGTCVPGHTSGPCDPKSGPVCGHGYYCDGMACRAKLLDGSPCDLSGSSECEHQCNLSSLDTGGPGVQPAPTGVGVCGPVSLAEPQRCGSTP